MVCAGTFIPAWLIVGVIVILAMFAFGLWPKVWEGVKWIISKFGGSVSPSVDAVVASLFAKSDSYTAQSSLRVARMRFKDRKADAEVATIDKLLAVAATWIDDSTEV